MAYDLAPSGRGKLLSGGIRRGRAQHPPTKRPALPQTSMSLSSIGRSAFGALIVQASVHTDLKAREARERPPATAH